MKHFTKRPTRRQLLQVIGACQDMFGAIRGDYENDRSPDRAARVIRSTRLGFELCVETLGYFGQVPSIEPLPTPPTTAKGGSDKL